MRLITILLFAQLHIWSQVNSAIASSVKEGSVLPAVCNQSQLFFLNTSLTPGMIGTYECQTGNHWMKLFNSLTATYQQLAVNNTIQTARGKINLLAGNNITIVPHDNLTNNSTDLTITSTGGSGPSVLPPQTTSLNFGTIQDGTCKDQTMTYTGILPTNLVQPGWPVLPSGVNGLMYVSAINTVDVRLCNQSGALVTLSAQSFTASISNYSSSSSTIQSVAASLTFPTIADGSCNTQSFTFTGAIVGSLIIPGYPSNMGSLIGTMYVPSANTVNVQLCNSSTATSISGTFTATLSNYAVSSSSSLTFPTIQDGDCSVQSFALSGANTGGIILAGYPVNFTVGFFGTMYVLSSNLVNVQLCNWSGAAATPSNVYSATVIN